MLTSIERTKLIEDEIEPEMNRPIVMLTNDGESITVSGFKHKSSEAWKYLNETNRPIDSLGHLIDIGASVALRIRQAEGSDFLERRVREVTNEFNTRIVEFESVVKEYLDTALSPEKPDSAIGRTLAKLKKVSGDVIINQEKLDKVFDPDNKQSHLAALQKIVEAFQKKIDDHLDENQKDSLPCQLRTLLDGYMGKSGTLDRMLNPDSKESPLSMLKSEMEKQFSEIKDEILIVRGIKTIEAQAVKGPESGYEFEDQVCALLNSVAKVYPADCVEDVSTIPGIGSSKEGDFVYRLGEDAGGGAVVIEARDRQTNSVTKAITSLTKAIQNRAAYSPKAGIYVVRDATGQLPASVSPWYMQGNLVICGIDHLALTIRLLRARLIAYTQTGDNIDSSKCCEVIGKVQSEVRRLALVKSKASQMTKLSNDISGSADDVRLSIEGLLIELEKELNKGAQP